MLHVCGKDNSLLRMPDENSKKQKAGQIALL